VHIAQCRREAVYDEVRDGSMQLLISGEIADGWRECLVDQLARASEVHRSRILQGRGCSFLDNLERLAVEHPDFVERVYLVVGRKQRAVSDEAYAFDLSTAAAREVGLTGVGVGRVTAEVL